MKFRDVLIVGGVIAYCITIVRNADLTRETVFTYIPDQLAVIICVDG